MLFIGILKRVQCCNLTFMIAPDADDLVLLGEVEAAVEVVGLDGAGAAGPEEVLGAPGGRQVAVAAPVLADLQGKAEVFFTSITACILCKNLNHPRPSNQGGAHGRAPKLESQIVAALRSVHVHCGGEAKLSRLN